ncbi:hypothetical protein BJ085DRAFT_38665 [Dimargaris cristalligena]|uniref:Reverse transcriptase domain-containing protein n=1 Tax=Dimargaris cristalligena TaxID=215637 RepID=A0A4P9ZKL1_9FUNG|nr:hypothetical protein BJ085DRAFT_38665 [Dimargaris cristalligena]|eukprot:RKP33635.1 hypothetical protein BJ085DRAFT_38665 [Dimargaris cristalligena]
MTTEKVQSLLAMPRGCTCLLGDLNVSIKPSKSGWAPPARAEVLSAALSREHLRWKAPPPPHIYHLDHAFVRADLLVQAQVHLEECQVPSDHPLLSIKLPTKSPISQPPGSLRFHIHRLQQPIYHQEFRAAYKVLCPTISEVMQKAHQAIKHSGLVTLSEIINFLDSVIVEAILAAASSSIGEYDAGKVRPQPDRSIEHMVKAGTAVDAIRLMKSQQRGITQAPLTSRGDLSTEEDVMAFFSETFAAPNELAFPHNLHLTSTDPLGIHVTAKLIRQLVQEYPKHKACGSDAIHTRMLYTLLKGPFPHHLADLFNLCLRTGFTPARWNESIINPIAKDPKAKHINEFRPIALTVIFRRLFEKLLLPALKNLPLSKFQAGFRNRQSTLGHVQAPYTW